MKKVIIVTGGIGSGKSVVCEEFAKIGAKVIQSDKVGHTCLEPQGAAYAETVAAFGKRILNFDGTINRKELGKLAFENRENIELLNDVTHKHILKEIVDTVDKFQNQCNTISRDCGEEKQPNSICDRDCCAFDMIVLEIPIFPAVNFPYDAVISVIASENIRVERVLARGGISRDIAESIMSLQPSNEEYRSFADYCIENDGGIDELRRRAAEIFNEIRL